ncbi:leucyl-tRNA synthetase [Cryphonectria parasitica EP155]|uniref:leucine--tRNA ligase n=1 Tax=Cryphonectria parasitica (strain ATCC 38755 / EP155) TaxID=660469 RepID=A0A9P4YCJ6_CRYP1|nr:leucyl-tRNA synthetase [Cryphonectria parasitica EP155]KAF3770992.1 leucyl-tRNA synthetase [Cryphonectria parasitica EP155]
MSLIYLRPMGRRLPNLHISRLHVTLAPRCHRLQVPKFDLTALDVKWRAEWNRLKQDQAHDGAEAEKQSRYILPMFPYPSGRLHIGHLRVYTIADVLARFYTLQGEKPILPMGWDAFGLPAENAAIQRGINPAVWTKSNITKMKEQMGFMNGSWDWDREISTCHPEFYKHTQKIFLMLHEKGLAYQAEAEVNYDPVDKTVLANEQVDANGCSWRSGAKVEKRRLKQWFFKITEFRESLLQDLEVLAKDDAWPERVLAMQKNWLGKSEGAMVKFPVMAHSQDMHAAIEVFTTRPDTLFGVQYLALAATHPIVQHLAETDPELQAFLDTLPGLPPDSKVGYMLPSLRAINPLAYHEDTPASSKESLPVYVAPYVLGDYGEGAVMGVPGHDLRDNAFWKEHHYDQPVRIVLAASEDETTTTMPNEPFVKHGVMTAQSGPLKGKSSQEGGKMLIQMLEAAELAKPVEKWRLRDWLVSRQRYWGTPIPIIHCASCGAVPVPDDQLPVKLPEVDNHWAEGKPGNPLESATDWINTSCPKCGGSAKRDTDTMDTFVDSSWYYMRFIDPHNADALFSAEKASLLPVDIYLGGIEHAILHLLYARFIYKFLMTSAALPDASPEVSHEPFARLITQGMVHGKTFIDPSSSRFLTHDEVDLQDPARPRIIATGEIASVSYEKMSKSKFNGVDPTELIARHGADATRAHMLFQAPVSDVVNWDEDKIAGVTRWLGRILDLVVKTNCPAAEIQDATLSELITETSRKLPQMNKPDLAWWDDNFALWRDVQRTIESVTESYRGVYSLNTIISDLMSLTNTIAAHPDAHDKMRCAAVSALVRMLAPIAPAVASECWQILGAKDSLFSGSVSFPVADGTLPLLKARTQACAVQINGKLRVAVDIPRPPEHAMEESELKRWFVDRILEADGASKLGDADAIRSAKKVIVVRSGRVVNFVL